ncbi:MAG: hypothetical protein JWS10_3498 [Cypionkella sp.]|uniref:DUF2971 domain-containing protein n=1 Tax=Cypionkella sp. TaxID=2811411 RepID=UPI0026073609|nr:DUF2971 domain-containing protein [Cypionkella sp.]MDB5660883.1 hypothetical protein [Cypionkella sp.]
MLYKFVGGDHDAILNVFEKAVVQGSIKFNSAFHCNDPFEFKFRSVAPKDRETFDEWHRQHAPEKTEYEKENAWRSFEGDAKEFNTQFWPRVQLMGNVYVSCLSQRWDSHLMWAHYCNAHTGFVVCYDTKIVDFLKSDKDSIASGAVNYSLELPCVNWFSDPPSALRPIMATKSLEWSYEKEIRFACKGEALQQAIFKIGDQSVISGIILGSRASQGLIKRALDYQKTRESFIVKMICSKLGTFDLATFDVEDNAFYSNEFL